MARHGVRQCWFSACSRHGNRHSMALAMAGNGGRAVAAALENAVAWQQGWQQTDCSSSRAGRAGGRTELSPLKKKKELTSQRQKLHHSSSGADRLRSSAAQGKTWSPAPPGRQQAGRKGSPLSLFSGCKYSDTFENMAALSKQKLLMSSFSL